MAKCANPNEGAIRYTPPNPEDLRPGISQIIVELRQKHPRWPYGLAVARAKEEWHKRNPSRRVGVAHG